MGELVLAPAEGNHMGPVMVPVEGNHEGSVLARAEGNHGRPILARAEGTMRARSRCRQSGEGGCSSMATLAASLRLGPSAWLQEEHCVVLASAGGAWRRGVGQSHRRRSGRGSAVSVGLGSGSPRIGRAGERCGALPGGRRRARVGN
jgi:hypothetical protein